MHEIVDTSELSDREKLFVTAYVKNFCATDAARLMGASDASAPSVGCRLLAKPAVQELIQQLVRARLNANLLTIERVDRELARLAFSDIGALYNLDGTLKHPSEMSEDARAALASIEVVEDRLVAGVVTKKIKMYDKGAALALAAKRLGMLVDRVAVGGDPELPPISIEETARRIAFTFAQAMKQRQQALSNPPDDLA